MAKPISTALRIVDRVWYGLQPVLFVALLALASAANAGATTYTACTPDDVNYELCQALTARMDDQQAALLDVRHAVTWTVGVLVFALLIAPFLGRIRTGEGRV